MRVSREHCNTSPIFLLFLSTWIFTNEGREVTDPGETTKKSTDIRSGKYVGDINARSLETTRGQPLGSLNRIQEGGNMFSQNKKLEAHFGYAGEEMMDARHDPAETSPEVPELNGANTLGENSSSKTDCDHTESIGNKREDVALNKRDTIESDPEQLLKRLKRKAQPETKASHPEGTPDGTHEGSHKVTQATKEPDPQPEMSWPEPEPNWPEALEKWKVAWPLHTYGFAAIFTILALIPIVEVRKMYVGKTRKTALKSSLFVMIFLFCVTRATTLFVDPYGSAKRLDLITNQLLISIGHPLIISALSLLLLVLIDTTKMNVAPPRFQRVQFIVPVVTLHIALVLVTDFVVAYFLEAKALVLMCQVYFLVLGFLLAFGYSRVGWKIRMNAKANINSKNANDTGMRRLQYLITACAITSALISALTIYAAAGVFGIYSDVRFVEAWPWWVFQTSNRFLEIVISSVILLMNTRTSSRRKILPVEGWVSTFKSKRTTRFSNKASIVTESAT